VIDLGTGSEPNVLCAMSTFQVPTCECWLCPHVLTPNSAQIAVAERMLLLMFFLPPRWKLSATLFIRFGGYGQMAFDDLSSAFYFLYRASARNADDVYPDLIGADPREHEQ
jgi:hypothetical protein